MTAENQRLSLSQSKPYQRRMAVFLGFSMVLIALLVYGAEGWSPEYAPVFWLLFLLPIGLAAYIYGLGVGLGSSVLSTVLFVSIAAKRFNEQGRGSALFVNLVVTILVLNGAAALIGYFGKSQRRQRALYHMLNLLGERFSQELEMSELLKTILDQAMGELDADMGEILLWEEASKHLKVAASRGTNNLTLKTWLPAGESLESWLLEQNEPYLNNSLLEDPPLTRAVNFRMDLPGSLVAVPLKQGRQPFGLLCLFDRTAGAFSRRDLEILAAIARKSEVAIKNAHRYQQTAAALARRVEELSSIAEVDHELSASLDLQHIINLVLDRAIQGTNAVSGMVAGMVGLTDEAASHLHILALRGYPSETILRDSLSPWSTEMGIIGRVVRTGEPALVPDVRQDADYVEGLPGTECQLTVPITREGRVIGVLSLEGTRVNGFGQDALRFVEHLADHAAIAIANARLFEEERRRVQEMAAVNEINRAITASLDLDTTLGTILENAQRILAYFVAEICLWDANQGLMFTQGSVGDPVYRAEMGGFYRLDEGYTGWIARHRQSLLIPDVANRQDVRPKLDLPDRPIRSYLGVPLLVGDALVGTLELISDQVYAYTQQDLTTLQTFASQAAVAIENARLFKKTQRLLDEVRVLHQAGQAATSSLDLDQVLDSVAAVMTQAIGASGCAISRWDKDAGTVVTLADHSVTAGGSEVGKVYALADYPATAQMLETCQSLIVNLDDETCDPQERKLLAELGFASMLAVPLVVKDKVIGLVELYDVSSRHFTEADIHLSQSLANQAAIALENAQLYEAQRRRAEEMSGLYEIALTFSSTLDLDELLGQTMTQVVQLLDSEGGTLLLHDESRGMLIAQPAASFGPLAHETARFCIRTDTEGFEASPFASNRFFLSNDLEHDAERVIPAYRPFAKFFGAKSVLGVSLPGSDGNIGEIYVINKRTGPFTSDDERLLSTVASHFAVAVEKAHLYVQTDESLRTRVKELTALNRVSGKMNAPIDLPHVLNVLLEQALKTAGANHGSVMLLDAERQRLQLLAIQGFQAQEIEKIEVTLLDAERQRQQLLARQGFQAQEIGPIEAMPLEKSLYEKDPIWQVFNTKSPYVVADTSQDIVPIGSRPDTCAVVVVPILYQEQVVGIIGLGSFAAQYFTDEHVHFMQAMALQAAIAVGNDRAFQEQVRRGDLLRERTEQLSSLLSISRALRADLPLEEVLAEIAFSVSFTAGFEVVLVSVVEEGLPSDGQPMLRRVAMAGLPVAVFDEIKKIRQPLRCIEHIMRLEYQISQSYFFPFQKQDDWGRELNTYRSVLAEEAEEWQEGDWHPDDAMLVPLRGTDGQLLGIFTVDKPANGRRPTLFVAESLELFAYQAAVALENNQLYARAREHAKRLEQRARNLALVHRISTMANSSLDPDVILTTVAKRLVEAFDVDHCGIVILDPNVHGEGRVVAESPSLGSRDMVIPFTGYPAGEQIMASRSPVAITDVADDPRIDPVRESLTRLGIQSILLVPLVVGDEVIGSIGLGSIESPREFMAEDIALCQTIANQVAVAVENARLFASEQERRRLADILREVAEAVSATQDLNEVLEIILERLGQVVEYDSATIQLLTDNRLEIIAARGYEDSSQVLGLSFPLDEDAYANRETILSRRPRIVADVSECAPDERHDGIFWVTADHRIRSWLGVPLFFHDQPVGMITLDKLTPNFYDEKAGQMALIFANQAAVAIQNAHLFQETKRHVSEMGVLLEVSRQIAATLELEAILRTTVTHATQLVDASCGWILQVSSEEERVTRRVSYGLGEHLLKDLDYDFIGMGLEGWVVRERAPTLSSDLIDDERVTGRVRRWVVEQGLESAAVVPLSIKKQVVGILAVMKRQSTRPLDQHDLDLLTVMTSQAAVALENAQLFAERERSIAELSILYQTGRAISASLKVEEILDMIYTQVSQVMDASDNFYIAFYDEETDEVSFPFYIEHGKHRDAPSRRRGRGLTEYILAHKRPLLLPDRVRERAEALGIEPVGEESFCWLGVPMLAGDRVLGVIGVQNYEKERVYDQDHLDLLSTIAAQAAIAVRNAHLFQQVQGMASEMERQVEERTEELVQAVSDLMLERDRVQTLYRIASELPASLELDRVLNRSLSLICEAVGAPQASILLLDTESDHLIHRAALRRQKSLPRGGVRTMYRKGVGLAGWVLEHLEPAIVSDVTQDFRWLPVSDESQEVKSVLAVPVLSGENALGVLLLFHPRSDYFTKDHLRLVMTIGHQLASAINNADLYALVQESAERQGKLLRANQADAAKSQAILEAIADGVMVTDAAGQVILFNAAAARILGTLRETMLEQNIKDISGLYGAAGSSWAALVADWQARGVDEGRPFVEERLEIEDRIVSVHLAPVHLHNDFLGTVSVFRDITRDVEVARMKSDFVSVVSHELRTPMTAIKGFVDLLLLGAAGNISQQQRHFLTIIKSNVDRLATLVSELLDLDKIETGRMRLELEPIFISDVIKSVLDSLLGKIKEKGLELTTEVPDKLSPVIGDRNRLIQILTNLVANAYQYTPSGGQIHIKVEQREPILQVTVSDTGIGISDEDQTKIFRRFFRAEHPVVRDSEGTGLGLPIVRSLVELHGGKVEVHSLPGKGSEFAFTLPLPSSRDEGLAETPGDVTSLNDIGRDDSGAGSGAVGKADEPGHELIAPG